MDLGLKTVPAPRADPAPTKATRRQMQLKSQVEWALHCCAILAGLPANRYLATKVLAEFHGVPKEYLSKAL